ncbi:hypothetical protein BS47DRAFT_1342355 [Hydnum rufescens UP504]|uniref:Wax synthase domain-containing protein n=1 Tax=Hydnum rufescens UP504 TaxID=1448309 RepID=A0A9P6B275_9AGAM|nr:hypothetical protein BS47DRAFT_1342355 [Hydnum rufescens UP504]
MVGLVQGLVNYCVPRPEDKVRMTLGRSPHIIATFLTLVTLAALARQPGTRFLRLAISPFAVILTLRLTYGFVWWDIPLNSISFVAGCYSILMIMKVLQLGLSPNGILKLGEKVPGEITVPASDLVVRDPPKRAVRAPGSLTLVEHFLSGLEVLTCARGIGWEFGSGTKIQIPPETRDVSDTSKFLRQTCQSAAIHFLYVDLIVVFISLVPGIGTPDGGSIFVFGQNTVERYLISALLHFITSLSVIYKLQFVYNLVTLIGVGLIGQHPTSWPPVISTTVITSTSMHSFWARDWHQAIFGPSGLIWGAFLASGVLHVWALYVTGRGTDWDSVIYFGLQPLALIAERAWYRVTKRRVGGFFGWIWTWLWIQVFGQFLTNSWHRRGFSSGRLVRPAFSPTRNFLLPKVLPYIQPILQRYFTPTA